MQSYAQVIDFVQGRRLSIRDSIGELLDFVEDVIDDLGGRNEINYIRSLITSSSGTGADQQIAVYNETGSLDAVIHFLMQQTTKKYSSSRSNDPKSSSIAQEEDVRSG